jgi:hypothetical protein
MIFASRGVETEAPSCWEYLLKSILNQFALIGIQRILEIKNTQYESEVVILTSGPLVEKSEVEFLAAELGI